MKYLSSVILLFVICLQSVKAENKKATNENQLLTDSLQYITHLPYIETSGDPLLWRIVEKGKDMVPYLISKLDDTTETNIPVRFFGGNYTVADLSFRVLQEIIADIPTFELLGIDKDSTDCGYCAYWYHLRESIDNRQAFKKAVTEWYDRIEYILGWVESFSCLTGDCFKGGNVKGHFAVRPYFTEHPPFRQLDCGLWINNIGGIAYKSFAMAPPDRFTWEQTDSIVDYFIDRTYNGLDSINDYVTLLKDIVDTTSFQFQGDFYFKDKNYVYFCISMAYGGHLVVNHGADVATFKALSSPFYACDKNDCYFAGREIEGADPTTFRVLRDEDIPISRDKNNFYKWNERMTEEEVADFKKKRNF